MRQHQVQIGGISAGTYNAFFQKVNRILSGLPVLNTMQDINGSVAYCDLKEQRIAIDYTQVSTVMEKAIAQLKGLNYHELAHLLYTRFAAAGGLKNEAIRHYHNVLEDGKIEALFSTFYPKSAKYFRATVCKFILNKANKKYPENYLLLHNRRGFLPVEAVNYYKAAFSRKFGAECLKKAIDIMDRYMVANTHKKSLVLAMELHQLMMNKAKIQPTYNAIQKMARTSLPLWTDSKEMNAGSGLSGKMVKVSQALKQQDTQAAAGKAKGQPTAAGKGGKKSDKKSDKSTAAIKAVIKDDGANIEQEAAADLVAVRQSEQSGGYNPDDVSGNMVLGNSQALLPHEEMAIKAMTYKLSKLLKAIQGNRQGGIDRGKLSGKVDMRSALVAQANGNMRIFSKDTSYTKKKVLVACSILVDESGSVSDVNYQKEIMAAKAISQAIRKAGGECQVYAFASGFDVKKKFRGNGIWYRQSSGGTRPYKAMDKALPVQLAYARRKGIQNNLVIVLSDGEYQIRNTITKAKGVTYAEFLIGMDSRAWELEKHKEYYNSVEAVPTFDKLFEAMEKFLVKYQKEIKRRVL